MDDRTATAPGVGASDQARASMTLAGAAASVWRRWWLVVGFAAIAVGATFLLTPVSRATVAVQYQAKAILVLNPAGGALPGSTQVASVNLDEAALEATVGPVPALAAKKLGYVGNPSVLAGGLNVTSDANTGTVTIVASGSDGPYAASVANTFATTLNSYLTQSSVTDYENAVTSVNAQLAALQKEVDQYNGATDPVGMAKLGSAEDQYRLVYDQFQQLAAEGRPQAPFNLLEKAVPVATGGGFHAPRSRATRMAFAGAAGLLLGIAVALLIERIRPKVRTRAEAEQAFGAAVLAEVPLLPGRSRRWLGGHAANARLGTFREAYRMLRTSILLMGDTQPEGVVEAAEHLLVEGPHVILVTSPLSREGKTTTVANLAVAMAESGRTVLACNADFRQPQLQVSFGLDPAPGLSDLLAEGSGLTHLAEMVVPTDVAGVTLIHAGSRIDNPAELITRYGAQLLDEGRDLADVVLIDTAPILVVSDASELLPAVDAVVMVARSGWTTVDSARRAAELLGRAGIPLLGVVLVGVKGRSTDYYAEYSYLGVRPRRPKWHGRGRAPAAVPAGTVSMRSRAGAARGAKRPAPPLRHGPGSSARRGGEPGEGNGGPDGPRPVPTPEPDRH